MRHALLLLALLACGPEDVMAGRRAIPPAGPVGPKIGPRRDLSLGAGLANQAYQPVDMAGRSSPTTVPLGAVTALGAGLTDTRAYISRLKGLDDDIDVATVTAFAGSPAAGTETLGVALYEVIGTPPDFPGREQNGTAFTLRLMPGCSWFRSVAAGAGTAWTFEPTQPTTLERSRSYAAAVVWSTNALTAGSMYSVTATAEIPAIGTQDAITPTTGFPVSIPVDERSVHGVTVEQVAFRVRVDPTRPVSHYLDFY